MRVSMATPASLWRAASACATSRAASPWPAVRMVTSAPTALATSTARSTAAAAVSEPSLPTRILRYTAETVAPLAARLPVGRHRPVEQVLVDRAVDARAAAL